MTDAPPISWPALRQATPARIGLGRAGTALTTAAQLDFQLAHARARDAVHAALDAERIGAELGEIGLEAMHLRSAAPDRATYLRRPDLGRRLDVESRQILSQTTVMAGLVPAIPGEIHWDPRNKSGDDGREKTCEIAFVIADGLSATAVNAHAVPLIKAVLAGFGKRRPRIGPVAVVEGGRVAIGDEIGGLLGADLVVVLIGERPGLSAADSLGIYVTWQPAHGAVDAARNCLSNIRPQGMPIPEAAEALLRLMANARQHRMTGVALSQRLVQA
jgi:ethanolamine ammonia-lyase small subunit